LSPIIGPATGAGKSTLVHALIGADKIQGGISRVDWLQNYRNVPQGDAVFSAENRGGLSGYRLLPQKTVFENVAFALEVCGVENTIKNRVHEVLKVVGLTDQANHFYPISFRAGKSSERQ